MHRRLTVLLALTLATQLPAQSQGWSRVVPGGDTDSVSAKYREALGPENADSVPEPGAMALLATGLLGLMGANLRQQWKRRGQPPREP